MMRKKFDFNLYICYLVRSMNLQQSAVAAFYDSIAANYDKQFESKANYQIPTILQVKFARNSFSSGSILDIGCGTGKLADYLNHQFAVFGIEVSPAMAQKASVRGYSEVQCGPAEEVLSIWQTKSVDHVVACSSLYFIENINLIIRESMRIARKSIFVSLEQFDVETQEAMFHIGIRIYNHHPSKFGDSTVIENAHLWTRPSNGKKIFGDIVHKIIQPLP